MPYRVSWDLPEPSAPGDMNPADERGAQFLWAPTNMAVARDGLEPTAAAADVAPIPRGLVDTVARRFRCVGRDGTSRLYKELLGDTRTVSKCPADTRCFQNLSGRAGIQCDIVGRASPAYRALSIADGDSGDGAEPTPLYPLNNIRHTSSVPRAVSLNVVMPTIALKITDDLDAALVPTAMVVAPDPSWAARLVFVTASSSSAGVDLAASPDIAAKDPEDDLRTTSSSSTESEIARVAAQPNDSGRTLSDKQTSASTDDSSAFSVVYMTGVHAQAISLTNAFADLAVPTTPPPPPLPSPPSPASDVDSTSSDADSTPPGAESSPSDADSTTPDVESTASSRPLAKTAPKRANTRHTIQPPTPASLPPQRADVIASEGWRHYRAWMIAEDG
ncbi:hypothetical protein H4R19_005143, partial [Coemansia spiralis]